MVEGAKTPAAPPRSLGPYLIVGAVIVLCTLILAGIVALYLGMQFLPSLLGSFAPMLGASGGQMLPNGTWVPYSPNGNYPLNTSTPNAGYPQGVPTGGDYPGVSPPNAPLPGGSPGSYEGYPVGSGGQIGGTGTPGGSGAAGGTTPNGQNPTNPNAPGTGPDGLPVQPGQPSGTNADGSRCGEFTQACGTTPCCSGLVCTGGMCQLNLPGVTACFDSDVQDNRAAGVAVRAVNGQILEMKADACANANALYEYDCMPDGSIIRTQAACPLGCRDGACLTVLSPDPTNPPGSDEVLSSVCLDSDGGINFGQKGMVSVNGILIGTDGCTNNRFLEEYYCLPNGSATKEGYALPGGMICEDGAILPRPGSTPACTDSDGGIMPNVKGTLRSSSGFSSADMCTGAQTVLEWYCTSGGHDSQAINCSRSSEICQDGACVPFEGSGATLRCTETDGGDKPYAAGTTEVFVNNQGAGPKSDRCDDPATLQEYFCNPDGTGDIKTYSCANGCLNGACIPTPGGANSASCEPPGAACGDVGNLSVVCCSGFSCLDGKCQATTAGGANTLACNTIAMPCGIGASGTDYGTCCSGYACLNNFCQPSANSAACQGTGSACVGMSGNTPIYCCPGLSCGANGLCQDSLAPTTPPSSCMMVNAPCGTGYDPCCSGLSCVNNNCRNLSAPSTCQNAEGLCGRDSSGYYYGECCAGLFCGDNGRCQSSSIYTPPPSQNAPFSCNDSDGGLAYTLRGVVVSNLGNGSDYCANTSTVMEYSCLSNGIVATPYNCPANSYCYNGACVGGSPPAPTTAPSCNDSDGGDNLLQKGTTYTAYSGPYNDSCYNATHVTEYYCSPSNSYVVAIEKCPTGKVCVSGACTTLTVAGGDTGSAATCRDTDYGNDPAHLGTVSYGVGQSVTDVCRSNSQLYEYYCNGTQMAHQVYNCTDTCSNGACTPVRWCHDSDNGANYDMPGTLTTDYGARVSDFCVNSSRLAEYLCSGVNLALGYHDCGAGNMCYQGHCTSSAVVCNETDLGRDIYRAGTTNIGTTHLSDYCEAANTMVHEYYCTGPAYNEEDIACPSGYHCANNACVR
ncbi:Uncharacterised protein [uncultured archaeon]|nr:Uncharacterised protein [uncultured archaeon]